MRLQNDPSMRDPGWGPRRSRPAAIAGGILAAFLGGAIASPLSRGANREDAPHAMVEQLGRVLVQIENRYVDPIDRARLVGGAIKGMVAELDPHSEYLPPKEYADFNGENEGSFAGIGVEVDVRGDTIVVVAPIEGGPAEAAGIRAGDEIVSVDGRDPKTGPLDRLIRSMRGEPGTKVELIIRRPSEGGARYRVPLVRRQVHLRSVDFDTLPAGVAYLRVRQFQDKTHEELVDAIRKVREKIGGKIRGVVLDLRRNPGGLVDQAVAIADEFLEGGLVFSMRGHGGKTLEEVRATAGGALVGIPATALIDEGSASAAELLAGALQDHKRATIVGAASFGKGSVQSILELPGGSGLKLTTARYYTPNGHSIQAQGVEPDVVVEATRLLEAKGTPIQKEKDLVNALPAEAAANEAPPRMLAPGTEISTAATTTTEVAATAPPTPAPSPPLLAHKPDIEHDFQLRMAHQIVTGVLMKRP